MINNRKEAFYLFTIAVLVLFAGCSGVFPGGGTPAQTPRQTPDPTPGDTFTSTPAVTPDPVVTPTPTPEGYGEYQAFAQQLRQELVRYGPGPWVQETAVHANDTISVYVERPDDWTVKRTEMEVVREAVRGTVVATTPNESEAESTEKFLRPDAVHVHVRTEDEQPLTSVTLDTSLAVSYADGSITMEKFAERTSRTRVLSDTNINIGENTTLYYLKIAEWRLLKEEQIRIINNTEIAGNSGENIEAEISKINKNNNELYYEYIPPSAGQSLVREGIFMKSYWESIRNVSSANLINRYPDRMRVYADVPGGRDMESSIRTEYAFDFLEITDGNISDENILTSGAWDAYYNKINRTRYPGR